MVELQLKKAKLDRDGAGAEEASMTAEGHVLSRNDLLDQLMKVNKDQKIKSA